MPQMLQETLSRESGSNSGGWLNSSRQKGDQHAQEIQEEHEDDRLHRVVVRSNVLRTETLTFGGGNKDGKRNHPE